VGVYTDHSAAIAALRARCPSDTAALDDEQVATLLAADLLEAHDDTGISLDNWISAREFVERRIGREIEPNGV
jgi:hypothetical protein